MLDLKLVFLKVLKLKKNRWVRACMIDSLATARLLAAMASC